MLTLKRVFAILGIAAAVVLTGAPAVLAASSQQGGIVQSYGTTVTVRRGMIVGFAKNDTTKVEPLAKDNVTAMLGAAISASDAPLLLSNGSGNTAQVYVATSGRYNVLISNENGNISVGDYISISTLNGIGMKADDNEPTVLGRAAAAFSGGADTVSTATIRTAHGTNHVAIGSVPVDINVTNNPTTGHGTGNLPGFLQIASSGIANKPVSAPRVYLSLAILLVSAIIAGSLLYSGVRGSLISIGRNPLARKSIIRGLMQVVATSILVFILGLGAVYLLLRL